MSKKRHSFSLSALEQMTIEELKAELKETEAEMNFLAHDRTGSTLEHFWRLAWWSDKIRRKLRSLKEAQTKVK